MSTAEFRKLIPSPQLSPPKTTLRSPGGIIPCEGQFKINATHRDEDFPLSIYVVNTKTDNLLGRGAAVMMGLVKRIEAVEMPFGELDSKPVRCQPVKICGNTNNFYNRSSSTIQTEIVSGRPPQP